MFTDAASLGKDRVLLAASVASLPQEPLGPGGCCLVALAKLEQGLRRASVRRDGGLNQNDSIKKVTIDSAIATISSVAFFGFLFNIIWSTSCEQCEEQ